MDGTTLSAPPSLTLPQTQVLNSMGSPPGFSATCGCSSPMASGAATPMMFGLSVHGGHGISGGHPGLVPCGPGMCHGFPFPVPQGHPCFPPNFTGCGFPWALNPWMWNPCQFPCGPCHHGAPGTDPTSSTQSENDDMSSADTSAMVDVEAESETTVRATEELPREREDRRVCRRTLPVYKVEES